MDNIRVKSGLLNRRGYLWSRRGAAQPADQSISEKAGRRAACLGIVIIIVIAIVLIAVGPFSTRPVQHGADIFRRFYRSRCCGCVVLDVSYYGNLMALVYCSLMIPTNRADLGEAVGVRSQHL